MIDLIQAKIAELNLSGSNEELLATLQALPQPRIVNLDAGGKVKLLSVAAGIKDRLTNGIASQAPTQFGPLTTTIGAICLAALTNLESDTDAVQLRLNDPQTAAMISILQASGVLLQSDIDALEFLTTVTTYPFESITLRDVCEATGTSNSISVNWVNQRYLKLTIAGFSGQPVSPMITITNNVFTDETLGRTVQISKDGAFVVDLAPCMGKAIGATTLKIEMWVPCSISAELI